MKFGENHKVDIETVTGEEAPVYLEFLEHEHQRHQHEIDNAVAMVKEHQTAEKFWESAILRHEEARDACGDLIDTVAARWPAAR